MDYTQHIKPISYLKSRTAKVVKDLAISRQPMLITQNGEAKLVVMDVRTFEAQERTMTLLKILVFGGQGVRSCVITFSLPINPINTPPEISLRKVRALIELMLFQNVLTQDLTPLCWFLG